MAHRDDRDTLLNVGLLGSGEFESASADRPPDDWRTEAAVVHDAQGLATDLPGMTGEITRTGEGHGPSRVTLRQKGHLVLASVDVGFPLVGCGDVGGDSVVLGICVRSAHGSLWQAHEVTAGSVVVMPPGISHQAHESEHLAYEMVVAPVDVLGRLAESLGRRFEPHHGFLEPTIASRVMCAYREAIWEGREDILLSELTSALSEPADGLVTPYGRTLTSQDIVRRVNEYLEADSAWLPPSSELCIAAHTSQRRLEYAFQDVYGMRPSDYLRRRALSAARSRLERCGAGELRIAEVAAEVGFRHPGRFAVYYRCAFGETPSETLNTATTV